MKKDKGKKNVKRLPIKEIQSRWTGKLIVLFQDDIETIKKYEVCDATVRRTIKGDIKK